jgi:tetratricopeptide (TPR) repeat protein
LELLGNIYNRMGLVLEGQGKYDEALQMYEKSLKENIKGFGTEHCVCGGNMCEHGDVLGQDGEV